MNAKEKAIELITNAKRDDIMILHDPLWEYPATGDDEKTCPMLRAMFSIEKRSGTIIFIPD